MKTNQNQDGRRALPGRTTTFTRVVTAVIAAERPLLRSLWSSFLRHDAGISVLAEVATADEVARCLQRVAPEVLFLHSPVPGAATAEIIRRVRYESTRTRVVVLADESDTQLTVQQSAVRGVTVLSGGESPTALIRELTTHSGRGTGQADRQMPNVEKLSPRQAEILDLAARGLSNIEIGAYLSISPSTVKRHMADSFLRLSARSRIDAVNKATFVGLIGPPVLATGAY